MAWAWVSQRALLLLGFSLLCCIERCRSVLPSCLVRNTWLLFVLASKALIRPIYIYIYIYISASLAAQVLQVSMVLGFWD